MSSLTFPTIKPKDSRLCWGGFIGCSSSLAISNVAASTRRPLIVITPNIHFADRLQQEINFFSSNQIPVAIFPDWETLPYDHFSPHQDIISDRLALLAQLPQQTEGVVIASLTTLMQRLLPKSYLIANSLFIKIGDRIDLLSFRENLVNGGYRHVGQVMEHGEFSVRGAIIDLFPMGSNTPYRIEFFDNEIESIRTFDTDDQRTIDKIEKIRLLPAREFPLDSDSITRFRQSWREKFSGNPSEATLYQQVSEGIAAAGIEYYLPLSFNDTSNFFDYIPQNSIVVIYNEIQTNVDKFWNEVKQRYEQLRFDIRRPLCPPDEIFLTPNEFNGSFKEMTQLKITERAGVQFDFSTTSLPDISINHRITDPLTKLKHYLCEPAQKINSRILFCTESTGRRETLLDLLKTINIYPKNYTNWQEFILDTATIGIIVSPVEQGVKIDALNLSIITESQLFGEQVKQRQYRKQRQLDPNLMIRNLTELSIGAPVVHLNHGVGRYMGLQTIKTGAIEAEYLTLEYADSDKIYVPVASMHLISRYTGADSERAPLQKLGTKQWDKIKQKTTEQIRDAAAELLDIYGRRLAAVGFAFEVNKNEYQTFADSFPFEETPDQLNAINDVLNDMSSSRCMDRLVCGDVGFGKTEVAMRAAFIAVQNNKQVAVLVPTTLLANQHLQNFKDRFADWPVKIAGLSRLQNLSESAKILKDLADGKVDIIIGTHKLLSQQIKFKDLGLLIIDEEQRFGVQQKEKITALRAHIDILTLTATPIPRTLNMALAGTRDLSIIATPPLRRLSVKTFVHEDSPSLIREAVLRETMRGGQIYYLHNEVATIEAHAAKLREIVPEARIMVAHGQMREKELERVMSEFYHQHFNMLICTTIIESGIDIPSANTIIINRADCFGLAQLHQLRGRVGRSHHQAYAYLITPPEKSMTKDAVKRLEAIAELGEIGVGFNLATYDLEIRGAGELLGEEQSGHIHAVGFSLYMELLEEAVAALKSGREPAFDKPLNSGIEIDLGISALLPKEYVGDVHVRLTLYKRLANCKNTDEVQEFKAELIDRFGLLPLATQNLFDIAHLKLQANQLGIGKIEVGDKFGYLQFNTKPNINLEKLISLIQRQPKQYQLQGTERLRYAVLQQDALAKIQQLTQLMRILS